MFSSFFGFTSVSSGLCMVGLALSSESAKTAFSKCMQENFVAYLGHGHQTSNRMFPLSHFALSLCSSVLTFFCRSVDYTQSHTITPQKVISHHFFHSFPSARTRLLSFLPFIPFIPLIPLPRLPPNHHTKHIYT